VLHACWQRCRVHFMRNAVAHAGRNSRRVVSAFIATAFAQDDARPPRPSGAGSPTSCVPSCPSSPSSWTRPNRTSSPT
jgi:transposase-like protein